MIKKISILMIVVMLLSVLSGCGNNEKNNYPETVDSNLVEGVDYIDHALTYDE